MLIENIVNEKKLDSIIDPLSTDAVNLNENSIDENFFCENF